MAKQAAFRSVFSLPFLALCAHFLLAGITQPAAAQDKLSEKAAELLKAIAAEPASAFEGDPIRKLQFDAMAQGHAAWGYWGTDPAKYTNWTNHSNRLIPMYTFGIDLSMLRAEGSVYTSAERLRELYGRVPDATLQPNPTYFDQTDVYRLQMDAAKAGKKHIVLIVFDGMDWQTTWAAATAAAGKVSYSQGRGTGLFFQDYRGTVTDYGYFVTSPHRGDVDIDTNAQLVLNPTAESSGGYDPGLGGTTPWEAPPSRDYLIGQDRSQPHVVTDSASSATSMTAGVKTYNNAINLDAQGNQVTTVAHYLQQRDYSIGVVTSVPISHATPASAYSHNVSRNDYQDLTRDLLGLRSIAHRATPLPGVDVLLGAGWGESKEKDASQGENYIPGNRYLAAEDRQQIDVRSGGQYVVAERTAGATGADVLRAASDAAIAGGNRLFGFFGVAGGHLPYQTADGRFDPTIDMAARSEYVPADITENPTLAEMTGEALRVLERNPHGFWLMVESGDVDWANHANNIDNSIGAVLSGDAAFRTVIEWVERRNAWQETAIILTADHGHYLHLVDPSVLTQSAD